jgi:hypothetical protein
MFMAPAGLWKKRSQVTIYHRIATIFENLYIPVAPPAGGL